MAVGSRLDGHRVYDVSWKLAREGTTRHRRMLKDAVVLWNQVCLVGI